MTSHPLRIARSAGRPLAALVLACCLMPLTAMAQAREVALPSLAPLVDSVKAAVVNVDVESRPTGQRRAAMERFFGEAPPLRPGAGSGFIISPGGLVITNNHVIDGAVSIQVRLGDGRTFEGEVIGRDPLTDVALVKLKGNPSNLPSVGFGDSAALHPGDWVVAIGNPFELSQSVSAGIISALDRQISLSRYDQFLQTDAAINPGNSGGPLFNLRGEVVGMNTAILGAASGIGFAVPSNVIRTILPQLQKDGFVTRGYLGISIQDVTPLLARAYGVKNGAIVSLVTPNSPSAKAGLREDDIITKIDGEAIPDANALTRSVAFKRPATVVRLTVARGKETLDIPVTVGVRPDLEKIGDLNRRAPAVDSPPAKFGLAYRTVDANAAVEFGLSAGGVVVVDVAQGSLAERAGFRRGMIVVEVNRKPVRTQEELASALGKAAKGSVAIFRVIGPEAGTGRRLLALEVP